MPRSMAKTTPTIGDAEERAELCMKISLRGKLHIIFMALVLQEPIKPIAPRFGVVGFAKYLAKCKNAVVLCGAGISTAAGIPDFRSPGTGFFLNSEQEVR